MQLLARRAEVSKVSKVPKALTTLLVKALGTPARALAILIRVLDHTPSTPTTARALVKTSRAPTTIGALGK